MTMLYLLKSIFENCLAISLVAFVILCFYFKHLKTLFWKWSIGFIKIAGKMHKKID